jgi:hypothetical protein
LIDSDRKTKGEKHWKDTMQGKEEMTPETKQRASILIREYHTIARSHIAINCSCFRKSVGDFVILSGDIPETDLDTLVSRSLIYYRVQEQTFIFLSSYFLTSASRLRKRSRFAGSVPLDVRQPFLYALN